MDLHNVKKYAAQMVPYFGIGKSVAHKASKSLMETVNSAVAKDGAGADVIEKAVATFKEKYGSAITDKVAAHMAVKLLSSRTNTTTGGLKAAVGQELLAGIKAEHRTDALTQVFSHYEHKTTQRNVAAVALGASGIATIGAFAGAGPAGLIPLLVGVLPSATALAKSRKATHRLAMLNTLKINKETIEQAKVNKADQAKKQAEATAAKAAEKEQAKARVTQDTTTPPDTKTSTPPEPGTKQDGAAAE